MENRNTGIIYTKTGESRRGKIRQYHRTQGWELWKNKSKWKTDLKGMSPTEISETIDEVNNEYECKFRIGFEVEKSYFFHNNGQTGSTHSNDYGDAVGEYELFRGFETDSSCGVEAITHILPLLPKGRWRTKVFDMFHKARYILEDEYSMSNGKCGGHICLSVDGISSRELFEGVRKFSGIIQSLYRMRLYKTEGNNYCNLNMTMSTGSTRNWTNAGYRESMCFQNSSYGKYSFCKLSDKFIEFRVPPRVTGVKCLQLRYELMYELVKWGVKYRNVAVTSSIYTKFLRAVKPIILRICSQDEVKTNVIVKESRKFQRFIDSDGEYRPQVIKDFILNTEELNRHRSDEYYRSNPRRENWKNGIWI